MDWQDKMIVCGVVAVILVVMLFLSFTVVGVGEVGLKVRFGQVVGEPMTSGIHGKIPFIDSIKKFDTKVQKIEVKTSGASKDLQDVSMQVAVNYSINPTAVQNLYSRVGTGYEKIVLQPSVNEVLKAVVSQYTAEELITKRQEVSVGMGEELTKKLTEYGIIADNINILDLSFSEAFNQAIEAKQVAQQNALKAQQDLERVKVEAEQQIAQARAEAESYKLKNQEITDKTLQLKWIEKWNGQLPSVMSDGTNILDLSNLK